MSTDYASLLNERQLQAVTTRSQYVRIIAGAGSGKTRVLTYRIAYLIENMLVSPRSIMAVTFTNKAANEMKGRLARIVPDDVAALQVSTFHSFCCRFLRKESAAFHYPPGFLILDEDDTERIVKAIASEKGYKKGDPVVKNAIRYISNQKGKGRYPDEVKTNPFANEKIELEFYREYEKRKLEMFALDFDDLILMTVKTLESREDIRDRWLQKFDHILIDEYQDTDDLEYHLIKLLLREDTCLYVVGDPDQTIYTWRGANQGIILNFPKEFRGTQDIVLDRNYRSTKTILDAANNLIAYNKKRVEKDLYTEDELGAPIQTYRGYDAEKEAEWVAKRILEITRRESYSSIAVLYRASYLTRPFETEFARLRIPYRIFGGLRFYQRKEVKDVISYFRLLLYPKDDVSFERIVNVPKRNIGESSVVKIKEEAASAGLSMYSYCLEIEHHPETNLPKKAISALIALTAKMEDTKKKLGEKLEAYSAILRNFITDIGYFAYLAEDENSDEDRAANVNALFDDINAFIEDNPDSSFEEYLQNIALLTSQDDMLDGDYVSLMTIHVAKGLEFDNVFIIGLNNGVFPSLRTTMENGNDGMEEERRLAYVAMTRAKHVLCMSCNSAYTYVTDSSAAPSQFFEEAGLTVEQGKKRPLFGGGSYSPRPQKPSWLNSVRFDDFDDEELPDEPEEKKPAKQVESNGITDWKVGDPAYHEKFGYGVVTAIVNDVIIEVEFESHGKKQLLATHKMLSRKKKGAQA